MVDPTLIHITNFLDKILGRTECYCSLLFNGKTVCFNCAERETLVFLIASGLNKHLDEKTIIKTLKCGLTCNLNNLNISEIMSFINSHNDSVTDQQYMDWLSTHGSFFNSVFGDDNEEDDDDESD